MVDPLIISQLNEELGKEINFLRRIQLTVKGITIDKKETKLLQYADDTTVVLSDINSAQTLFKLLDDFKMLSGLEVNPTTIRYLPFPNSHVGSSDSIVSV